MVTIDIQPHAPTRPLEDLSDSILTDEHGDAASSNSTQNNTWALLSLQAWASVLAYVEVYPDDFIIVVQDGQTEHTNMTGQILRDMDSLFCPNDNRYI